MSTPDGSLTAVVQSGGKQYRVAPGDRILVDRLASEPGAEISLEKVLLVADGDQVEVGTPHLSGVTVAARVVGHERGPKISVFRYKSKKRVRVHKGARADLTAIEVLDIGGRLAAKAPAAAKESTGKAAKAEKSEAKPARTRSSKASPETAEEAPDGA